MEQEEIKPRRGQVFLRTEIKPDENFRLNEKKCYVKMIKQDRNSYQFRLGVNRLGHPTSELYSQYKVVLKENFPVGVYPGNHIIIYKPLEAKNKKHI